MYRYEKHDLHLHIYTFCFNKFIISRAQLCRNNTNTLSVVIYCHKLYNFLKSQFTSNVKTFYINIHVDIL